MYPWMRVATEAWLMAIEGATVVGLRSMAAAARDAKAQAKTNGMIGETLFASLAWQTRALTGGLVPSKGLLDGAPIHSQALRSVRSTSVTK